METTISTRLTDDAFIVIGYYISDNQGEPMERSNEVHDAAVAFDQSVTSMNEESLMEFERRLYVAKEDESEMTLDKRDIATLCAAVVHKPMNASRELNEWADGWLIRLKREAEVLDED